MTALLALTMLVILDVSKAQTSCPIQYYDCIKGCDINGKKGQGDFCSTVKENSDECAKTKCDSAKCSAFCGRLAGCLDETRDICTKLSGVADRRSCDADCNGTSTKYPQLSVLGACLLAVVGFQI
ncbi:unnamed protein product [Polarella glacialis]|uniref:Uncharacterized protein n=1 Tax=Polarella glacialis TaxID=89957 RepID=A0A813FFK6_POLGL|nr:unnamed protein product [Polarella glacialis]